MWNLAPGRIAFAHETQQNCLYCVDPLAAGKSYVGSLQGMSIGRDLIIPQTSDPAKEVDIAAAVNAYFQQEIAQVVADPTYQPVTWLWSGNSVYASSILGKYAYAAQQMVNQNTQIPAAIKQKWTIRVVANNWGIGETTPSICGDACNHDNFYGLFPVPRYGDIQTAQSMSALIALHDEYAAKDTVAAPPIPARSPSDYRDVRYVQGYAAALMWQTAVESAIDAGHTTPTGDDIKNALETFKNISMSNMTAGPITFTAGDHRPQSTEVIYKLDANGQFQFVNNYSIELVPDWLGY
jgi:branched-chain amino acid transport system substrate-binding protein